MGAPKQRWTPEEEAALRAGVQRHGQGKWRSILKDPEFGGVLHMRSNVDLKDKWRNMNVTTSGSGPREGASSGPKRMLLTPKQDEDSVALANVAQSDEFATSSDSLHVGGSKKSIISLDDVIIEAIVNMNDPEGSNSRAIFSYIEDHYNADPAYKGMVSAQLKSLTTTGKLAKTKQRYVIAPTSSSHEETNPSVEGIQEPSPKPDGDGMEMLTRSQVDSELASMKDMTLEEAAAFAAQAVADAEAAIAAAEQAVEEAEIAESHSEAAQALVDALEETSAELDRFYYGGPTGHRLFGHDL